VRWSTFLAVLLWNTSGYDSVGAVAAEVENPGRDFPRAMVASIVLISLVYVLPVGAGVSLDDTASLATWTDGSLARVADEQVGGWLSTWICLGGALSAFGLLNTLLCAAARILVSSAEIGVVPARLATLHPISGAPIAATLVLSGGLLLVLSLSFATLVEFSMLFYGATAGLEFLALLRLRKIEPHTPRPYRVPLSDGLPLAAFCAPPIAFCALLPVLAKSASQIIFILTVLLSLLTYYLRSSSSVRARRHSLPHTQPRVVFARMLSPIETRA